MKKQYETPTVEIEEYEIESLLGNLCSGGSFLLANNVFGDLFKVYGDDEIH